MHKLFEFIEDEKYKLMLDMSKELHSDSDPADIRKRFSCINKRDFYDVCFEHELDGVVGCYALSIGIELPDYWMKEYYKKTTRQNYLKEKAKEICSELDQQGIPMVILKNGGIMISMVPDAVKCPMEDIDSLIKKSDFYKAHEILISNGFTFKFRSQFEADKLEEAYRHGSAEYYIDLPDGDKMWFELSWRAIDGRWIRPDLEPNTDEFIDRSYIVDGTKVHVLSPEDNLLQVCVHTAKHSYCRAPGLRLHMDVDRILAHNEIDWELFLKKVENSHVRKSTYLSLFIPTILFGTQVPQKVLDRLKTKDSDKLLNMLSNAGLPHPMEKKFTKIQFLRFQTKLYDKPNDMIHTLYPNKKWIEERYGCKGSVKVCFAVIKRGLDLVGIRGKK